MLLVCWLSSCACSSRPVTALYPANDQVSDADPFITVIAPNSELFDNGICATIDAQALWQVGNTTDAIWQQIRSATRIEVDGVSVEDSNWAMLWNLSEVAVPNSDFTAILGSYPTNIQLCFSTAEYATGVHVAVITTESLAFKRYSTTFSFEN
jgi:hypothetical protein